jgi:hypothetical protein
VESQGGDGLGERPMPISREERQDRYDPALEVPSAYARSRKPKLRAERGWALTHLGENGRASRLREFLIAG